MFLSAGTLPELATPLTTFGQFKAPNTFFLASIFSNWHFLWVANRATSYRLFRNKQPTEVEEKLQTKVDNRTPEMVLKWKP